MSSFTGHPCPPSRSSVSALTRYFPHRAKIGLPLGHVANLVVGPVNGLFWRGLIRVVVVELLLCLLSQETLKLRPKLVAARQVFVVR
jgi:hypothetical protein